MIHNKGTDSSFNTLFSLGWDSFFQHHFDKIAEGAGFPARVVGVYKNYFLVSQGIDERLVTVAGRVQLKKNIFPVIGDWVTIADKVISDILPRKNVLSRGAAGSHGKQALPSTKEQIFAANLDTIFIVSGTDRDFNLRRIERYLTLVYNCGLDPVIILTKADLHQNPEDFITRVNDVAFGVPVHLVSAIDSQGMDDLESYLSKGKTISMIGSSGAGKSTLLNRLYGKSVQATRAVSENVGKGRHTTTSRSLVRMPLGGMIIDNPGIREIGLWDDKEGLGVAFPEIEALAQTCRFSDCTHSHEPGCQVCRGLETGAVQQERLESYHKMKRELAYLSDRQHKSSDRVEKERWKGVALKIKQINKFKGNR